MCKGTPFAVEKNLHLAELELGTATRVQIRGTTSKSCLTRIRSHATYGTPRGSYNIIILINKGRCSLVSNRFLKEGANHSGFRDSGNAILCKYD